MIGNVTRREMRNKLFKISRIIGYTNYAVTIGNGVVDIIYYVEGLRLNVKLQPLEFAVFSDDELAYILCKKLGKAMYRYTKEWKD